MSRFAEDAEAMRPATPDAQTALNQQQQQPEDPAKRIPAMPASHGQQESHLRARSGTTGTHGTGGGLPKSHGASSVYTDDTHGEKRGHSNHHDADRTYPLFSNDLPWSQRTWAYELIPFRGMWYDLRRRKPFYISDWTEGFKPKNWWIEATSVVRMYFIK